MARVSGILEGGVRFSVDYNPRGFPLLARPKHRNAETKNGGI
jgi:hypothetical protein